MHYQQVDHPVAAPSSPAGVTGLADLAGRLHHRARPYLYEALGQAALIQTVREFPPEVLLQELARTVADDALRRALRLMVAEERSLAAPVGGHGAPGWHVARTLALVGLAEDAARELERVRLPRPASARWDG